MNGLDHQLEALRSLSTAQLRQEWQRVWKEPAPRLGHDLLRRGIAWKLQEQVHGGLPRAVNPIGSHSFMHCAKVLFTNSSFHRLLNPIHISFHFISFLNPYDNFTFNQ